VTKFAKEYSIANGPLFI